MEGIMFENYVNLVFQFKDSKSTGGMTTQFFIPKVYDKELLKTNREEKLFYCTLLACALVYYSNMRIEFNIKVFSAFNYFTLNDLTKVINDQTNIFSEQEISSFYKENLDLAVRKEKIKEELINKYTFTENQFIELLEWLRTNYIFK
jgi:hypothetical protein